MDPIERARNRLDASFDEDAPEWAQIEAMRSSAFALIALVEVQQEVLAEQRLTNKLLTAYVKGECGSVALDKALHDPSERSPIDFSLAGGWGGDCGVDDD